MPTCRASPCVQTLRVIILTGMLPLVLAPTGLLGPRSAAIAPADIASPLELAALAAAAVAVALLLRLDQVSGELDVRRDDRLERCCTAPAGSRAGCRNGRCGTALVGIGSADRLAASRKIRPLTVLSHVWAALGSFAVAIAISAVFVGDHRAHHAW